MSELGRLGDSTSSGQKKIFAIVSPPTPADLGDRTIRRILIFDNHPDSVRLVFGHRLDADVDFIAPKVTTRYIIPALIPVFAIVLATLWLLL